jgi:hypothetical protein
MMTIDEFATISLRIIAREGFVGFQATACYPARGYVRVLSVPANANIEAIALRWAFDQAAPSEEVLVAFKIGPQHFKVLRREGPQTEDAIFAVDQTLLGGPTISEV